MGPAMVKYAPTLLLLRAAIRVCRQLTQLPSQAVMLADLSENAPRAIALIDVPDLRSQLKRIGSPSELDSTAVLGQLEADPAELYPASSETRLLLDTVYLYSPG